MTTPLYHHQSPLIISPLTISFSITISGTTTPFTITPHALIPQGWGSTSFIIILKPLFPSHDHARTLTIRHLSSGPSHHRHRHRLLCSSLATTRHTNNINTTTTNTTNTTTSSQSSTTPSNPYGSIPSLVPPSRHGHDDTHFHSSVDGPNLGSIAVKRLPRAKQKKTGKFSSILHNDSQAPAQSQLCCRSFNLQPSLIQTTDIDFCIVSCRIEFVMLLTWCWSKEPGNAVHTYRQCSVILLIFSPGS